MLLCAMRPYRDSPAWQLKQAAETRYPHRYTEINLSPLSSEYSADLVGNLLEISDIPPALSGMILEKSEGNPFFVEELIRTLIDSGVVVRDESGEHWRATAEIENITVPDNLQALLTARIDRLDREIRETVQLASVIGRTFYLPRAGADCGCSGCTERSSQHAAARRAHYGASQDSGDRVHVPA